MTRNASPAPPAVACALLSRALPDNGIRESVLGDLHELFVSKVREADGRTSAAWLWYWVQAVRLGASYAWRRVQGRVGVGFVPETRPAHRGGDGMMGMVRGLRFSLRSLARSPGFTVPALLILAVGMTSATAIFTVVDSIAFRPLDLPDSERLVILCEDHPRLQGWCGASPGNVEDFRAATSTLSDVGIARTWLYTLEEDEGSTGVHGGLATAGFFRALGVRPLIGRLFNDDEHGADLDNVVLLTHEFWTTHYGADPTVIGRTVRIDGEPNEIVGVLPGGFDAPLNLDGVELWKPPHFDPLDPDVRGWRGFRAIGRLGPGATRSAAQEELRAVYAGLAMRYEEIDGDFRLRVTPLLDVVLGDSAPLLYAFLGAAALLLLIVCANVANLLLARGMGKQRELAVRVALGAGRSRLVKGILTESLVLAGVATLLALLLSNGVIRGILAAAPAGIPRLDEVGMDARVFVFAATLAVLSTIVFALLPALRVTSWDLGQTVKSGAREGDSRSSSRLRNALVVAELALSVVLLSSAGLLSRSFAKYLSWDPGFDRSSLLAVSAFPNSGKYDSSDAFIDLWRRVEESVGGVPGVLSVASASAGPLFGGGDGATPYLVEGQVELEGAPSVAWFDIGPRYFATLGVPVMAGREFTEADSRHVEPVAVVNQTMARKAWPGEEAVGKLLRLPELERAVRIVGVVADVDPMTPGEAPSPEIYWPNRQYVRGATFILVRTRGDGAEYAKAVTEAALAVDPDLTLGTPGTLAVSEARQLVLPRFQALIILAFGLAALALSAVGVYAVVAYAVARRVREMGIRMALGARAADVVALVLGSSLGVAVMGVILGVAGSLFLARFLRVFVHGVSPTDPLTLSAAGVVLVVTAALAALLPARRATRVDPLDAIRAE